jgi:hypothetical protein
MGGLTPPCQTKDNRGWDGARGGALTYLLTYLLVRVTERGEADERESRAGVAARIAGRCVPEDARRASSLVLSPSFARPILSDRVH